MPAKVTLFKLVESHEVEVPDQCPNCGAPFCGPDSELVEWDYTDESFHLSVEANGGLSDPIWDSGPNYGDTFEPLMFMCRACQWTLE